MIAVILALAIFIGGCCEPPDVYVLAPVADTTFSTPDTIQCPPDDDATLRVYRRPAFFDPIVCPELHWDAELAATDTLLVTVYVAGYHGKVDFMGADLLFDRTELQWEGVVGLEVANWNVGGSAQEDTAFSWAWTEEFPLGLAGERVDLWQLKFSRLRGWDPAMKQFRCTGDLDIVTDDCEWGGF